MEAFSFRRRSACRIGTLHSFSRNAQLPREFSAQILKGGLGFVVRAADEQNYQAIKLVTLKPGPFQRWRSNGTLCCDGKEVIAIRRSCR